MDWIDLASDGDKCRAVVNSVKNLSDSTNCWEILE
jgi:hypothetical protein